MIQIVAPYLHAIVLAEMKSFVEVVVQKFENNLGRVTGKEK